MKNNKSTEEELPIKNFDQENDKIRTSSNNVKESTLIKRSNSLQIKQNESKIAELERNNQTQNNLNQTIKKDDKKNTPSNKQNKENLKNNDVDKDFSKKNANRELVLKNNRIKEFKEKIEKFEKDKKSNFIDFISIENEKIKCIKISYQL